MQQFEGKPVRAFVVWEPVLPTDWFSPSTAILGKIPDRRAVQFWDRNRLISHSMGEHNGRGVVWDYIAVYPAGAVWKDRPTEALYQSGPVIRASGQARAVLAKALQEERQNP